MIEQHGTVDGISLSMPNVGVELQAHELILIKNQAVQLKLVGLSGAEMCDRYFDIGVTCSVALLIE